jgi:hypothetical protein
LNHIRHQFLPSAVLVEGRQLGRTLVYDMPVDK